MKKEALVAIILGIILGVGGAAFLIVKTSFEKGRNVGIPQTSSNVKEVGANQKNIITLEVTEPQDGAVTTSSSITIKGKTQKNSLIVINSQVNEVVLPVTTNTDFSTKFSLALGENTILVSVYPKDPKVPPQHVSLKVYYLDEE